MVSIAENIELQEIKIEDQAKLMLLMEQIYPPVYKHLWVNEDCSFYLNRFYSIDHLKLELSNPNATYYFVHYNSNLVGIFRLVFNEIFKDLQKKEATYLHRIYLGKKAQGKGVAKQLLEWAEHNAKRKGNILIWLEAMDSQQQALRFYEKQGFNYGSKTGLDFELIHPNLRGMYTMFKHLS